MIEAAEWLDQEKQNARNADGMDHGLIKMLSGGSGQIPQGNVSWLSVSLPRFKPGTLIQVQKHYFSSQLVWQLSHGQDLYKLLLTA